MVWTVSSTPTKSEPTSSTPAGPGTPDDAAQAPTYSAPAATVLGDDEISATPTPPIETLPAPDPTGDETSSDTQTGQV